MVAQKICIIIYFPYSKFKWWSLISSCQGQTLVLITVDCITGNQDSSLNNGCQVTSPIPTLKYKQNTTQQHSLFINFISQSHLYTCTENNSSDLQFQVICHNDTGNTMIHNSFPNCCTPILDSTCGIHQLKVSNFVSNFGINPNYYTIKEKKSVISKSQSYFVKKNQ